jgi:hypothetical protein
MIVAVGSAQEPAAVVGCAKRRLLGSSDGPFMSQAGSGRHWLLAAAGVDALSDAGALYPHSSANSRMSICAKVCKSR